MLEYETPIDKLEAVNVANKVIWVNPKMLSPLLLTKGTSSILPLLLQPTPNAWLKDLKIGFKDKFRAKISDSIEINPYFQVRRYHGRTGLLAKVSFSDQADTLYREIDLKGIGRVSWEGEDYFTDRVVDDGNSSSAQGLADLPALMHEAQMAEKLITKRIRTYRFIGIIKLEQLVVDEKNDSRLISIKEAKQRDVIDRRRQPAVGIRAFATRLRVEDLHSQNGLLEESRLLVAEEMGKDPKHFGIRNYVEWFAQTLGKQIALLHKAGFIHHYLSTHNITADCRIVDLDSVTRQGTSTRDVLMAMDTLGRFVSSICHFSGQLDKLIDEFTSNYEDSLNKR